jgi:hypothetical protein
MPCHRPSRYTKSQSRGNELISRPEAENAQGKIHFRDAAWHSHSMLNIRRDKEQPSRVAKHGYAGVRTS